MLRRDGFFFLRTGQFLERADNTARLLDVKYHVRLPQVSDVGGVVDYYQWLAILRVVGARRAYRVLYKGRVEPAQVAELLIIRARVPALAGVLLRADHHHLDAIEAQDSSACRRSHAPGALACMPTCASPASTRSSRPACTNTSPT